MDISSNEETLRLDQLPPKPSKCHLVKQQQQQQHCLRNVTYTTATATTATTMCLNATYNIDHFEVSTCCTNMNNQDGVEEDMLNEEEEDMSVPRCTASSTFQVATGTTTTTTVNHNRFIDSFRSFRRRQGPCFMSLRSGKYECYNYDEDLRDVNDSCLLMSSEIEASAAAAAADSQSHMQFYQNESVDDDDENQTYVSELPTILPDFDPSSSSSSSSSSCNSSEVNDQTSIVINNNNNTSIKAPTCRSLYKYLLKRVSKRLGNGKKSAAVVAKPSIEARHPIVSERIVQPTSTTSSSSSVRVYAHNHKREAATTTNNNIVVAPTSCSTANTSTATMAYLVHRRSNFYATNEHLREIASPIGMKNFEWNRLNCGEFFSYNV